jgi:hypothetical protein
MLLRDVIYVVGLKKNLVSVSTIEDRGYEVLFCDGNVLLYPKGSSVTSAKLIWIQHENLYKLMFQTARALMHSANNSDLGDLWNRRMSHLHHGALSILKEIMTGVPKFSAKHHEVCKGCALGKYTKTIFLTAYSQVFLI